MSKQGKVILIAFGVMLGAVVVFTALKEARATEESFCRPAMGSAEDPRNLNEFMKDEYGELVIMGMDIEGAAKIIYGNPETREGTILNIGPDRVACTGVGGRGIVTNGNGARFLDDAQSEPEPIEPEEGL